MAGELKPAEALNLADQVEYAEGSVVSRAILQKQVGTLTLFAFDQGQGLSEHSAPYDALVQILDGEVEITIGGEPIRARAGQTVLMPANVPHALQSISRFKMLLTMIRSE
ncbi:cupin domain-containing protein [Chloroflexota bacterium]